MSGRYNPNQEVIDALILIADRLASLEDTLSNKLDDIEFSIKQGLREIDETIEAILNTY